MTMTIGRYARDDLHALMAYRFFVSDDLRLQRAREAGVAHEQLAREFYEDMQLMGDLGWLPLSQMEALGMPEGSRTQFELTQPADALRATLERARLDARYGANEGCGQISPETEERRERFRSAERTCEELLAHLDTEMEASP